MTGPLRLPVVRTGSANIAGVLAGLGRLRAGDRAVDRAVRPVTTTSEEDVANAPLLVLPGVGAFGPVMAELEGLELVRSLTDRIAAGRPTLCVCLGLQLLARSSDESPGVRGLGVIDAHVGAFKPSPTRRVPQMGWNRVEPDDANASECGSVLPGHAYFANSFRLTRAPSGWRAAWARHGDRFVASIERDGVLACQFHPELSGPWGLALMQRWVDASLRRNEAAVATGEGGVRC